MRLLAELKEHQGCVNHVSFSSSGAGHGPVWRGSGLLSSCWHQPCADAKQSTLLNIDGTDAGMTFVPSEQLACLLKKILEQY